MAGTKTEGFVVLTSQRSGSTWLMDVLNQFPGITGHQELLYQQDDGIRVGGSNDYPFYFDKVPVSHRNATALWKYLDEFFRGDEFSGFKLMYSQLRQFPVVGLYLMSRPIRVIHLVRRNKLDVVISQYIANETGHFHSTETNIINASPSISLPTDGLVERIRSLERRDNYVKLAMKLVIRTRYMCVSYEELSATNDLSPIRHFFPVVAMKPAADVASASVLVKRQVRRKSELLENFEDVRSRLIDANLEHMLQ